MKKWTMALALALVAPAAFSQAGAAKTAKAAKAEPSAADQAQAAVMKGLRDAVRRDKRDLSAGFRAERTARRALAAKMTSELAAIRAAKGGRAEKTKQRRAVRGKYAALMKAAREQWLGRRRALRADLASKRGQILRLRRAS
ncbi:MAG: hypothetical protein KGM24_03710 [Elusimicrobia bacterium]|nr:hypothetical protein [Elusimicrobiota bacterium]